MMTERRPLDTAPRGQLIDVQIRGIPYLDCKLMDGGQLVLEHGYPSVLRIFGNTESATWSPRPDDRMKPYETNERGEKYVP